MSKPKNAGILPALEHLEIDWCSFFNMLCCAQNVFKDWLQDETDCLATLELTEWIRDIAIVTDEIAGVSCEC